MDEWNEDEILMAISLGGYDSIEDMEESAGLPMSDMEDTVAEYIYDGLEGYDTESDMVSKNDAIRLVTDMMNYY